MAAIGARASQEDTRVLDIYVDADACPVKEEIYRVAKRYDLRVYLVSNSWMRSPEAGRVELVLVEAGPDVADDWVAEHAEADDVVVTSDLPLAARCLEMGALVLDPKGRPFKEDSIGGALASRELLSQLRDLGEMTGGPAPLENKDRSRFLQRLDELIQRARRRPSP